MQRAKPIDRVALAIHRAAQKGLAHRQHPRLANRPYARAGTQHDRIAKQHHQRAPIAKANHLGWQKLPRPLRDLAQGPHRHRNSRDLQQASIAGGHHPIAARGEVDGRMRHVGKERVEEVKHGEGLLKGR